MSVHVLPRIRPSLAKAAAELSFLVQKACEPGVTDEALMVIGRAGDEALNVLITTQSLCLADLSRKLDSYVAIINCELFSDVDDLVIAIASDGRRLAYPPQEAPQCHWRDEGRSTPHPLVVAGGIVLASWAVLWLLAAAIWRGMA